MTTKEDIKNLSLWERMNLVRIEIYSDPENMTPDKTNTGNGQKFISGAKLRRVIAPLLAKYGIETVYKATHPEALSPIEKRGEIIRSQHYLAGCELTFVNIHDPTQRETYIGVGEGSEALDKSVSIAQSYAMRNVLLNAFQIVDGMEMEDVPEFALVQLPNLGDVSTAKAEEEKEEERSKALAKEVNDVREAIKPNEPVVKKKVTLPIRKTEEVPQTTLRTDEESKEVSKPVDEEKKPSETIPVNKPMTLIQKTAFETSKKDIQQMILDNKISPDEARSIGEFVQKVVDSESFKSFQNAYKFMTQEVAKRTANVKQ